MAATVPMGDVPGTVKAQPGKWRYKPTTVKFDPRIHLQVEEPAYKLTLEDFGYDSSEGITDVAAVAPFRLFSDEALRLMRNDLFSEEVQTPYARTIDRSPYMLRGYARGASQFIYDAWTHPETMAAMSRAAGVELELLMDHEIGHVNIQLGPKGYEGVPDLNDTPAKPLPDDQKADPSEFDKRPVDDWHYDGTPLVGVLMLSDTTGMVGGETAVMKKDGTIGVIPGPSFGKVAILQGSCIKHSALRAENCSERVAMVTSYRLKDPFAEDPSHLRSLQLLGPAEMDLVTKPWLDYRLNVLEERARLQRERLEAAGDYAQEDVVGFVQSTLKYLVTTAKELHPDLDAAHLMGVTEGA